MHRYNYRHLRNLSPAPQPEAASMQAARGAPPLQRRQRDGGPAGDGG